MIKKKAIVAYIIKQIKPRFDDNKNKTTYYSKYNKGVMTMDDKRLEELVINALEWAIEVSEQTTRDLIVSMGITPEELDAIGYDKENFAPMHEMISR